MDMYVIYNRHIIDIHNTFGHSLSAVLTISPSPSPSREEKDRKVRPTSPVLKGFKAFQPRRPKSYYENLSGAASESSEGTADSFWLDPSNRLAAQKGENILVYLVITLECNYKLHIHDCQLVLIRESPLIIEVQLITSLYLVLLWQL